MLEIQTYKNFATSEIPICSNQRFRTIFRRHFLTHSHQSLGLRALLHQFCRHKNIHPLGFVNPTHNRTLKPIDFSKFYQLQSAFGNFGGSLYLDGKSFPYSYLELSKPTGKYVDRTILKAINLLSTKGFIHYAGNACSPGLQFPEISNSGHVTIDDANNCGVQIINVQGMPTISNAVTIPAEPFMNLEIRESWKTFEDYISNMSSKYRVRTNKVLKTTENYIVQHLSIQQANEWIPQCAQLLGHTLKDKTLAISPNISAMLHTFVRTLKEEFKVWGYYKDGTLYGFITAIDSNHGTYAMHLGLTDQAAEDSLYQRMMYDVIRYGIENRSQFVCLGRTATEIKSTMGAVPVENSYLFFTKGKMLMWVIKGYKKYFHRTKSYQIRSPFKE